MIELGLFLLGLAAGYSIKAHHTNKLFKKDLSKTEQYVISNLLRRKDNKKKSDGKSN